MPFAGGSCTADSPHTLLSPVPYSTMSWPSVLCAHMTAPRTDSRPRVSGEYSTSDSSLKFVSYAVMANRSAVSITQYETFPDSRTVWNVSWNTCLRISRRREGWCLECSSGCRGASISRRRLNACCCVYMWRFRAALVLPDVSAVTSALSSIKEGSPPRVIWRTTISPVSGISTLNTTVWASTAPDRTIPPKGICATGVCVALE
mmetsp:Transcript_100180/g.173057  ORF Transcript_100180/g.173057 Transcript_100180/m.173057 type:complete len:204 (-) Transcript_100180:196-807(-)